jgi:hypothetical protein
MVAKINSSRHVIIGTHQNRTGETLADDTSLLSASEKGQLQKWEEIIETKLKAFFEVGCALMEIKASRLYRAQYATFEEYCRHRWDMSRIHAFRLLKAAEVHQALLPIGNIPLPENEAQMRPLTLLTPKRALSAWQKVLAKAGTGKITAKLVRLTVEEVTKSSSSSKKSDNHEEWQHEIFHLLKKAQLATDQGQSQNVSEILEKIRLVLDLQIAKEARRGAEIE